MDFQSDEIEKRKKTLTDEMIRLKGDYNSSSAELDYNLCQKNITMSHRFSHNYNLPNEMSPADYELYFYKNYELSLRLVSDSVRPLKAPHSDSLDMAVRQDILAQLPTTTILLNKEYTILQKLNPELKEIQPQSFQQLGDAIRGVIYRFDIPEIQFFLSNPSPEAKCKANAYNADFDLKNGFTIHYLLSPQSRDKLTTATSKPKISQKFDSDCYDRFMHYRQSHGHFDD